MTKFSEEVIKTLTHFFENLGWVVKETTIKDAAH